MELLLHKLEDNDKKRLFEFEKENRYFFEQSVPSRGEKYYSYEYFIVQYNNLLEEMKADIGRYYLIKDKDNNILGRLNLVKINDGFVELGFRIGKLYTHKGIATSAVRMIIEYLKAENNMIKVFAKTTNNNYGSQRVLSGAGFKLISKEQETFSFNGSEVYFLNYLYKL